MRTSKIVPTTATSSLWQTLPALQATITRHRPLNLTQPHTPKFNGSFRFQKSRSDQPNTFKTRLFLPLPMLPGTLSFPTLESSSCSQVEQDKATKLSPVVESYIHTLTGRLRRLLKEKGNETKIKEKEQESGKSELEAAISHHHDPLSVKPTLSDAAQATGTPTTKIPKYVPPPHNPPSGNFETPHVQFRLSRLTNENVASLPGNGELHYEIETLRREMCGAMATLLVLIITLRIFIVRAYVFAFLLIRLHYLEICDGY